MKPKVYITKKIPKEVEEYISQYCDYKMWDKKEPITREELLTQMGEIDGLLTNNKTLIDSELLEHAPKLKVVSNIAVGYNNFDTEAMKARSVLGTHTPFVLDETVADLACALLLAAARRISEMDKFVKSGRWNKSIGEPYFGLDVHHATLGILGLGRIGAKIAKRAKLGFEMNVLYYDKFRNKEAEDQLGVEFCEMVDLLLKADFILVMLPLTKETYHLIGKREFEMMNREGIFINCSRGEIVDESALIQALKDKQIKGAALDVFEKEPIDPTSPLLQFDNVITVPHLGSATNKTRLDMAYKAAKNLIAGVTGKVPTDIVRELKETIVL